MVAVMDMFLTIIVVLAMLATLVTLILGVVSMMRGGQKSPERSNKLMRYRVAFQGIAVLVFLALLVLRR